MTQALGVITVSEMNRRARIAIERCLPSCWVAGEISNLVRVNSGHWYFTLKDERCGIKCAFFRNRSQFIDWNPNEGDRVEVRAQATLYEPRGDFQLVIDMMRRAGLGELYEQFIHLKAKLESEGLFQSERKKRIPPFPSHLGIVTSLQAAALQDVIKTLHDRWPSIHVVIYPTTVQGTEAATAIIQAINTAVTRNECEILLLVRGGGSLEDLIAFSDENLARTIAASPIPIITGIGHETDFSIADFVADVRSSTPTGAAQCAVPELTEIRGTLNGLHVRIVQYMLREMNQQMQNLDSLSRRIANPKAAIANNIILLEQLRLRIKKNQQHEINVQIQRFGVLFSRFSPLVPAFRTHQKEILAQERALKTAMKSIVERYLAKLQSLTYALNQLNPEHILAIGYCVARTLEGDVIKGAELLFPGRKISLQTRDCVVYASVEHVMYKSS